ncbi:MAG TPA: zinc-binding dehydrogenase, partial [Nocardioidaceae bacterium]|nr:zinc-binding dehydrogenase [Nocardioidaceae bacterium]
AAEPGWVRVQVTASGMCHADIGTAAADGRGDVVHCPDRRIPGISYPGGWAESIAVPAEALARIPDDLDLYEAAPMGCAGVTTFNAVRHCGAPAGGRLAVFGIGGVGHLAVQFAAAMGFEVIAIARGAAREDLARSLGAHRYIDSEANEPGASLQDVGGADVIISTASTTAPVAGLVQGLRARGRLILIGADGEQIPVPSGQLVGNAQSVTGHITGSSLDVEETMRFAVLNGIRPMIERAPLEAAGRELERLKNGEPRFRVVLDASPARAVDG